MFKEANITDSQFSKMVHALGLDKPGVDEPYRNRYYAWDNTEPFADLMKLVERGFMKYSKKKENMISKTGEAMYYHFIVTDAGKEFVLNNLEKG